MLIFILKDTEIYQGLLQGGLRHDESLSYIYSSKKFSKPIKTWLVTKGLSKDEVAELWTDIVVQFSTLVRNGKYQEQSSMIGYIKNLSGYLFLNYLRNKKKHSVVDIKEYGLEEPVIENQSLYSEELKSVLYARIDLLGKGCKGILKLWSRDYSMEEIKEKLDIISVEATRKRKHICLKKLLNEVEGDQAFANLLREYY